MIFSFSGPFFDRKISLSRFPDEDRVDCSEPRGVRVFVRLFLGEEEVESRLSEDSCGEVEVRVDFLDSPDDDDGSEVCGSGLYSA